MTENSKHTQSEQLTFVVPGVPVAKARARSTMASGKSRHYTPKATRDYESLVAWSARKAAPAGFKKFSVPVHLEIDFFLPIPKSWSARKKLAAEMFNILPAVKPDLSNLTKAIEDGLNGIAFDDDKLVVSHAMKKYYGANPGALVTIMPVNTPSL